MKISHKVQYAVRAVLDIAHSTDGKPTQVREVAKRQAVPPPFLEQICRQLSRAGILRGRRGPGGGYCLSKPAAEVTIGDIYRAIEGRRAFQLTDRERGAARRVSEQLWSDLASAVARALDGVTVAQLCERAERGGVPPRGAAPYHYFI